MTTVINMRGEPVPSVRKVGGWQLGDLVQYKHNCARVCGRIFASPMKYDLLTHAGTVFGVQESEIKPMEALYV